MEYRTLEHTDLSTLQQAWVRAFSDYQVTIEMPLWKLEQMTVRRGYSASHSMGAFVDGELAGFTLNGVRDWNGIRTAYDVGTGVIPEFRLQGITSEIFERLVSLLRAQGIGQYLLEVLQTNTGAFELYRKKGFEITRRFACFRCERDRLTARASQAVESCEEFSAAEWDCLSRFCEYPPSWQNSTDSVRAAATAFHFVVARRAGEIAGFGMIDRKTGDVPQLAVAPNARRGGLGGSMLAELARHTESPRIAVINVDERSLAAIDFLITLGFERFVDQYEMMLRF